MRLNDSSAVFVDSLVPVLEEVEGRGDGGHPSLDFDDGAIDTLTRSNEADASGQALSDDGSIPSRCQGQVLGLTLIGRRPLTGGLVGLAGGGGPVVAVLEGPIGALPNQGNDGRLD